MPGSTVYTSMIWRWVFRYAALFHHPSFCGRIHTAGRSPLLKNITFCSWRRIFFSNRARPAVRMQTRSGATNCVRDYRIWLLLCQIQLMSPAVCCLYTCIDGFRSVNYPDVVQTLHKMPEIRSVFLAILPISNPRASSYWGKQKKMNMTSEICDVVAT